MTWCFGRRKARFKGQKRERAPLTLFWGLSWLHSILCTAGDLPWSVEEPASWSSWDGESVSLPIAGTVNSEASWRRDAASGVSSEVQGGSAGVGFSSWFVLTWQFHWNVRVEAHFWNMETAWEGVDLGLPTAVWTVFRIRAYNEHKSLGWISQFSGYNFPNDWIWHTIYPELTITFRLFDNRPVQFGNIVYFFDKDCWRLI